MLQIVFNWKINNAAYSPHNPGVLSRSGRITGFDFTGKLKESNLHEQKVKRHGRLSHQLRGNLRPDDYGSTFSILNQIKWTGVD